MNEEETTEIKSARHPGLKFNRWFSQTPQGNTSSCKASILPMEDLGMVESMNMVPPYQSTRRDPRKQTIVCIPQETRFVCKMSSKFACREQRVISMILRKLYRIRTSSESRAVKQCSKSVRALRAYVIRKPGIGIFITKPWDIIFIIYDESAPIHGGPQNLGKSNPKKTIYNSDVSNSSGTNITGRSTNSAGSIREIKRNDLRTRDDYNFS